MKFEINLTKDFTIKIGAHDWQVKFVDILPEVQSGHLCGVCVFDKQAIYINRTMPDSMKLSTFYHELLHAMESVYNVDMKHSTLNLVADVLAQVMLDNHKIGK